jgi:hypothetical protein
MINLIFMKGGKRMFRNKNVLAVFLALTMLLASFVSAGFPTVAASTSPQWFQNFEGGTGFSAGEHSTASLDARSANAGGTKSVKLEVADWGEQSPSSSSQCLIVKPQSGSSVDISAYNYLSFYVMDTLGNNTVLVKIKDSKGQISTVASSDFEWTAEAQKDNWTRMNLDLRNISGVDKTAIAEISVAEWWNGTYYFDDFFLATSTLDAVPAFNASSTTLPSPPVTASPPAQTATPTAAPIVTPRVGPLATPQPLKYRINTTYVPQPANGKKITVNKDGDLQKALDDAQLGDTIVLQAGATFTGHFKLKNKTTGKGWIYITSSNYTKLPAPGTRVAPTDAINMPKIVTSDVFPAISTETSAHHYRFVGTEIASSYTLNDDAHDPVYDIISLDGSTDTKPQTQLIQVPNNITFDRCYIHGTSVGKTKRGILMDSAWTAVVNSYISDIHTIGQDSQAIGGFNGPGPFKIVNNYLEASTENVMFGGSDNANKEMNPSDLEFKNNYLFKPLSWKVGDPSYAGLHWCVKNIFELKNMTRALVDGNVFENCWADGQVGDAILFTPRNQDGTAPWCVVRDITFTNNIVRNAAGGFELMGHDYDPKCPSSQQTVGVLIKNNLFENISGKLFNVSHGNDSLVIENNTAFNGGTIVDVDAEPDTNFIFRNNIAYHNEYGIKGTAQGVGNTTLDTFFPGSIFTNNVLVGGGNYKNSYPAGNFFPDNMDAVGFVNLENRDYHLAESSPYKRAGTNGKALGADIDALNSALGGIEVLPTIPVPKTPSVIAVDDNDRSVTGKADAKITITVKKGNAVIGSSKANSNGSFIVPIPLQKAGTVVTVTAKNVSSGIESKSVQVTVKDKTPPSVPKVNTIRSGSRTITGKAEAGATVIIKRGNTFIGSVTVKSNESFSVAILPQKAGTMLYITVKDKAGNTSTARKVIVVK